MAIDSAKSTTSTVSQAIKNRYYDKLFLRIAESKLVHKQLGQLNRKIEKGEGGYGSGVVYWTKWTNLPLVTAGQGEGVPTTAVSMSSTNVTGTTAQYDAAVSISDLLAYTSFGDVMKAAMERLAYNAGLSIDTVVRKEVQNSGTFAAYGNGGAAIAAAAWTSIPATATLGILGVRKAGTLLAMKDAMQQTDGNWVAVAHPASLYDLQADTTTGGWIDANKYTDGNASKLLSGEVGKLMGVRFLSSTNAAMPRTGVAASGTIAVTSFFGRDAFGVTELQGLKTYIKPFGSAGSGDPTDKVATAGWKTTFGAASLNSDFYVNLNHAISSTA
jgi:N4-gp56 family major capsid protein